MELYLKASKNTKAEKQCQHTERERGTDPGDTQRELVIKDKKYIYKKKNKSRKQQEEECQKGYAAYSPLFPPFNSPALPRVYVINVARNILIILNVL